MVAKSRTRLKRLSTHARGEGGEGREKSVYLRWVPQRRRSHWTLPARDGSVGPYPGSGECSRDSAFSQTFPSPTSEPTGETPKKGATRLARRVSPSLLTIP